MSIKLTEEVLLEMGFEKYGRDDMPLTISYEIKNLILKPLLRYYNYDGNGFGYNWYKTADNIPSSWKAIFEFHYKDELEMFLSCKKL